MPEDDRIEYVAGRQRSEAAQEIVDEAYMAVSVRSTVVPDDTSIVDDYELDGDEGSDVFFDSADAEYGDLLGSFRDEDPA
jgi:hypothetical protein